MDIGVGSLITHTNFLSRCFDVKEEIEDVDYNETMDMPNIKHEDIEIKSEEDYK